MASLHTPGPWEIDRDRAGFLLGVTPSRCAPGAAPVCLPVCFTPPIVANAEADARLIAAAPDLLEALDWLLASIEADPKDERYPGDGEERLLLARASARAAMARATGSAQ